MAEPCRIMLKQVAYNVFIGPLAVPILFELQHGLLKTGFSSRIPPNGTSLAQFGTTVARAVEFAGSRFSVAIGRLH